MYGTGNEATQANRNIEFITLEMNRLGISLSKDAPASPATEDEQALLKLTEECRKRGDDMLALLEKLKNTDPSSKTAALRATIRNFRKRHKKTQLEKELDSIQRQLNLQLTSMSRY